MDAKICLDTDVSIEILKNTAKAPALLSAIGESEIYISAVSVFEMLLRKTNLDAIEQLISKTAVLDFSELCARKASEILKTLKSNGKMIEMRDLFIASTAIVNGCTLATLNKKHFENISELKLLEL